MDSNTELAAELKAAIDYTAEKCANAPYVPVKTETAQAILKALIQPAEQIADGAVGVTQGDRLAAEEIGGYIASWHEYNRTSDYEDGCTAAARHAQQARAQALEEAVHKVTRPLIGLQVRTAQEVFDIMCDRFRALNGQGGGV